MPKDKMTVVQQGLIRDEWDFIALDLIDWSRVHGMWANPAEAMQAISSWLIGKATYTVVEYDLSAAPHRHDWPDWPHAGFHESLGRLFWNTFHACYVGELYFADEPDFFGRITRPREIHFWGDIARASASAFALTQKKMAAHDLWISVLDRRTQVIIEPFVSLRDLWTAQLVSESAS